MYFGAAESFTRRKKRSVLLFDYITTVPSVHFTSTPLAQTCDLGVNNIFLYNTETLNTFLSTHCFIFKRHFKCDFGDAGMQNFNFIKMHLLWSCFILLIVDWRFWYIHMIIILMIRNRCFEIINYKKKKNLNKNNCVCVCVCLCWRGRGKHDHFPVHC